MIDRSPLDKYVLLPAQGIDPFTPAVCNRQCFDSIWEDTHYSPILAINYVVAFSVYSPTVTLKTLATLYNTFLLNNQLV